MGQQTAGSRARQSGRKEAEVKAADEAAERGQRTIYVDGEPHAILGLTDLTWGEVAELEEYCGRSIAGDVQYAAQTTKGTLFIYYISRRREDPAFTLEEAEATPIISISAKAPDSDDQEGDDGDPPTSEGGG